MRRQTPTIRPLLLALFLLTGGSVQAETVIELDKIVIKAPKKTEGLPKTSDAIDVTRNVQSDSQLTEVIQRQTGIHYERLGGPESNANLSIRGSSQGQVQIIWDGVPLETASDQGINLNQISSLQIAKVEIFKTATPANLASTNMGGIVSLTSRTPLPGWHARTQLGTGSFETREAFGELTYGGKKQSFTLGLSFRYSKGNFSFLDNNGTPLNTADDQTTTRANNDNTTWAPYVKWQARVHPKFDLQVASYFFSVDKGVPGLENFQSQNARLELLESLSQVSITTTEAFSKAFKFSEQAYLRYILSEFSDPLGEIGLGAAQQTHNTTWIAGYKVHGNHKVSPQFTHSALAHYTFEFFDPEDSLSTRSSGSTSRRHQVQLAWEPTATLWSDTFTAQGKVQGLFAFYDINNDDPALNTPATFFSNRTETPWAASLALKKHLGDSLILKSSVAREVRLPKFSELFGDQGAVLGNPQLVSEKTIKYDVDLVWQTTLPLLAKSLRLETSFFQSFADDLIEFELVNGVARANNLGEAKITGVESFAYVDITDWMQFSLGHTYLHARQTSGTDRYLVGRPKHEVQLAHHLSYKGFGLSQQLQWIDDKYLDALNTRVVNNRLRWDLEGNYKIAEKYRLSVEAKNLTNSQVVDVVGFPLPGRSFFLRLSANF